MRISQSASLQTCLALSLAVLAPCATSLGETISDNFTGQWIENYESGAKKSQVTYENGQLSGRATLWYESGCPMSVHHFKNGLLDGPMIKWEECMDVVAIGEYRNGDPWDGFFLVNPSNANPILDTAVQIRMLPYYVAHYTRGQPYSTLSEKMLNRQLATNPHFKEILDSLGVGNSQ